MSEDWSDLHGEHERGYVGIIQYRPKAPGVYCKLCETHVPFSEMKHWVKDDDTLDLLCPGCDSVLVEGE